MKSSPALPVTTSIARTGAFWPGNFLRDCGARRRDIGGLRPREGSVRQAAEGPCEPLAEKRDGEGQPIPARHGVHDAEPQRFGGRHVAPRSDQVERRSSPDQTRQALRPTRTRDDPQGDFRKPERACGIDDAVVAAQRQFQPPAEGRAMQQRDHRLRETLDRRQDVAQRRRDRRFAELADIGSGHEGPPGADQHGAADLRVVRDGLGGPHEAGPNSSARSR